MPDARSPIKHHLVLYRRDLEGRARYFSLMIERDRFGTVRLVRNCLGYVGTKGREKVEIFSDETQAAQALEDRAEAQRRKGYADL